MGEFEVLGFELRVELEADLSADEIEAFVDRSTPWRPAGSSSVGTATTARWKAS